ncbi:MAG: DUF362 domain-containing protein [Clostridia bacterium]|nr:DUF362 domain-containing protein [Clostridia bacterium]
MVKCDSYENEAVKVALSEAIDKIGGLDWVESGMKIAIKANLVSFMAPEKAATTHPVLLCELVKMLVDKGAEIVIGDSPGGIYNSVYVNKVYKATGMAETEKYGAKLNRNFNQNEAQNPEGTVLKKFTYTAYLDDADAIINFCKLKTHGMMGMSAAAKNIFGVIPGTLKPEYHFRFPRHDDFARMMVDLDEYFKVKMCICDAVVGMEGNGPTMGTPRKIGAILASESPHKMDLVCAKIIGLEKDDVPTLVAAAERGLIPETVDGLNVYGNIDHFVIKDFKNIPVHTSIEFKKDSTKFFGKMASLVTGSALRSRPKLKAAECVGCGVCRDICPAKAIKIEKNKATIDRKLCIRCFCCQEFCPKGAMKVKRTFIARLLNK